VVRFAGLGVTGTYAGGSQAGSSSYRAESWSAGVYGELGLQYLITRHLGLGVRGDVTASRFNQHITGSNGTQHLTSDRVALDPVQIIAALYF
jgi:outer membrane protein W